MNSASHMLVTRHSHGNFRNNMCS